MTTMTKHRPSWAFNDRLRKVRTNEGLTQQQMADRLGVSRARYSNWEAGLNPPADILEIATRIENEFHVARSWLLGLED